MNQPHHKCHFPDQPCLDTWIRYKTSWLVYKIKNSLTFEWNNTLRIIKSNFITLIDFLQFRKLLARISLNYWTWTVRSREGLTLHIGATRMTPFHPCGSFRWTLRATAPPMDCPNRKQRNPLNSGLPFQLKHDTESGTQFWQHNSRWQCRFWDKFRVSHLWFLNSFLLYYKLIHQSLGCNHATLQKGQNQDGPKHKQHIQMQQYAWQYLKFRTHHLSQEIHFAHLRVD